MGLRAGLTVAASIPIAVLSISILRAFGRASILENNIVQTTGNAGQSIASGVIFTLPALVFLGFDLEYSRIFMLALIGGWLGVLFMIPLRRQLIVQEHGTLKYPEGTACADVLIAGERGGSFASRVFLGLGLGGLYTLFQNENLFKAWPGTPEFQPDFGPQHVLKGASIKADATPEYLGVGYIIGPKRRRRHLCRRRLLLAGAHAADLLLRQGARPPALSRHHPHRADGPQRALGHLHPAHGRGRSRRRRTHHPAPHAAHHRQRAQLPASRTCAPARQAQGQAHPHRRRPLHGHRRLRLARCSSSSCSSSSSSSPCPARTSACCANLAASLLVVVFGFLFVTVSSRIVGLVGSSANPISGMTIATLMATCAIFLVKGWTAPAFGALAITIGGVVCIAAANAGDTSQDLKTGYLVGSTPRLQQLALMIGVVVSTVAIGFTLNLMNTGLQEFHAAAQPWDINAPHSGVAVQNDVKRLPDQIRVLGADKSTTTHHKAEYIVLNALGSPELADGKYLYSPATDQIEVQWIQGIGSEKAAAPQARLMATVINGILSRKLPWGLVLLGVFLVIAVELLGIRSLTFAVGAYLSIGTTLAIFCGGVVRWFVDAAVKKAGGESHRQRNLPRLALRLRTHRRRRHRRPHRRSPQRSTKPPSDKAATSSTSPTPSSITTTSR